jgi:CubicO group peptidase (beta-lactamase class C family)
MRKIFLILVKITLSFIALFSILGSSTETESKLDLNKKIQAVENGLKQSILIKDQHTPSMNILERMRYYKVPAISMAVINNGKIDWVKAYNISKDNVVTSQTMFQAGSISKPISAVVALSLVEKYKLNLDQNVNAILKTWKVPDNQYTEKEKVTLRRLLSHTAGVTVHGFQGYSSLLKATQLPSIIQILNGKKPANNLPIEPDNIPGKNFSYSGGGFMIVQKILEDITQEKYSNLTHEIIFKPLKMTSSTFELIWPKSTSSNIALGHSESGKIVPGNWNILPESTAAGLWTTASDLANFVIEIQNTFNGQASTILSSSSVKTMLTKQPNSEMGLGIGANQINPLVIEFFHMGANVGYIAHFVGFTKLGKGAVIMTNSINGVKIIPEIIRSLADAYQWPDGYTYTYKIVQPITIDPAIYQDYVGKFEISGSKPSAPLLALTLSAKNNKLFITLPFQSTKNETFELTPESELKFFTLDGGFEIEFTPDNHNEFSFMGKKAQRVN